MEPSGRPAATKAARFTALGTGAVFAGALAYTGIADPHRPGFLFPVCPFRLITGCYCPACGGIRMTHDLLHGDIGAAVVDNVFLLVGLPLLAVWLLFCVRTGRRVATAPFIATVVVAVVTWTVVRNLPGFPLVPTLLEG